MYGHEVPAYTTLDASLNWLSATGRWGIKVTNVEIRELTPPQRMVHVERFEDPWYPGDATVTTTFTESGGRTLMTECQPRFGR